VNNYTTYVQPHISDRPNGYNTVNNYYAINSENYEPADDNRASLYASLATKEVRENIGQIHDTGIREKVIRFMHRFEQILAQELKRSGKIAGLRSLSLYSEEDYAEVTWVSANLGAGFVFERSKTSWFCFMSSDAEKSETFGSLTYDNCANKIREIIRYITR